MIKIYIDTDFFYKFVNDEPPTSQGEVWLSLFNFIFKTNNNIFFNNKIIKKEDLKRILQTTGKKEYKYVEPKKNIVCDNINQPFIYIFENIDNNCYELIKKNAIFITNIINYNRDWNQFAIHERNVLQVSKSPNNEFTDWSILSKYIYTSDSLIIVDNYILIEDAPLNFINIRSIFKAFFEIAKKNDITNKLQIIIYANFTKIINGIETKPKIFNKLIKGFSEFNDDKAELKIIDVGNSNFIKEHDRHLIFNYLYVSSGNTMVYLDKNLKVFSETQIRFQPIINDDTLNSVIAIKKRLKL